MQNILHNSGLQDHPLYVGIWTTKPYTLPMNQLVCCSPDMDYNIIEIPDQSKPMCLLWAVSLMQNLKDLGYPYRIIAKIKGIFTELYIPFLYFIW